MSTLQAQQVSSLPIGSGGTSATKKELNDNNTRLTMMTSQAKANTVFDPPAPKPLTPQIVQPFCNGPSSSSDVIAEVLMAAGVIFIAYGILAKK